MPHETDSCRIADRWLGVACRLRYFAIGCVTSPTEVEAACGECLFGLKGEGCDLAIRINGHGYYVDDVQLDSLGDAHAADGMCEVIRKARVTGQVKDGRFVASSFQMLPLTGIRR